LFWKGCEKESYPFGKLYQLLLLTGQRLGEVANMRWSQLDMAYESFGQLYKVWKLPPHSAKMDRVHFVPLSPMTIKLINSIPKFKGNDLLFPSGSSNNRTISGFGKSKKRICTFETDWRLNDLRRTVHTSLSRLEIDYMICNKVFGHIDKSIEGQIDLHDYLKQKQNALDKWSQLLTSIL
jgi:integrase